MKKTIFLLIALCALIPVVVFALGEGGIQGGGTSGTVTEVTGTGITVVNGTTTPALSITDNSITSTKMLDNTIATGKIADGTIVDADISASAAIDATKIDLSAYATLVSPSFTTPTLGAASATTLNTGQGAYELYAMDQNVRTTDNVVFNTVTAEIISPCTATDNDCFLEAVNTGDVADAYKKAGRLYFDNTAQCFESRNNDNTITFSAGCMVKTFSFGIDNVIAGDDVLLWKVARAITIISVTCAGSTADDIIGVLQECSAADQTSCADLDTTDWTMTNAAGGTTVAAAAMEDVAIAAGAWLKWDTVSVEVTNSSKLACTVQYRE